MALTGAVGLVRKGKFLLNENSRTILTGVGVGGTITTAYLSGRASLKAARIIDQAKEERRQQFDQAAALVTSGHRPADIPEHLASVRPELTRMDKVKLVWRLYIPPVGLCLTTVTCIIVANKIASKKIAALAVASGISERALQEYKAKVIEKLGDRQDTKIRDEVAQDRVNNHPVNTSEVILAGTGDVLCYDMTTGRYFQSSVEEIKRAENKINYTLNNHMYASLSEFYDEIGLPPTSFTDHVGWNANNRVEVLLSTTMSTDQRPCIAMEFRTPPFTDYHANFHD
jgi:Family of unknown function (DUF6353)